MYAEPFQVSNNNLALAEQDVLNNEALQHARMYARHIAEVGSTCYGSINYSAALTSCCYMWCGAPVQSRPILPIHHREMEDPPVVVRAFWCCGSHPLTLQRLGSIAWDLKMKYEHDAYTPSTHGGWQALDGEGLSMQRTRVVCFGTPEANRAYPSSAIFFVVQWTTNQPMPPPNCPTLK